MPAYDVVLLLLLLVKIVFFGSLVWGKFAPSPFIATVHAYSETTFKIMMSGLMMYLFYPFSPPREIDRTTRIFLFIFSILILVSLT